jgi:hypothetical protein
LRVASLRMRWILERSAVIGYVWGWADLGIFDYKPRHDSLLLELNVGLGLFFCENRSVLQGELLAPLLYELSLC